MSNYRQITDEIRAFLATADRACTPELTSLASEFAILCQEANGRLRRCIDYLRHGRRSEAIQLGESQPLLLDVVTALEFPEIDDWQQVCTAYGLALGAGDDGSGPRAQRSLRPGANPGRVACAATFARLVAGDRWQRLTVLRELSRRDLRNPAWQEDIRALEQRACGKYRLKRWPRLRPGNSRRSIAS